MTISGPVVRRVVVGSPPKSVLLGLVSLLTAACSAASAPHAGPSPSPTATPNVGATASSTPTPRATGPHSRVVHTTAVGDGPCGIAAAAGAVWVTTAGGRLLRLSPTTGRIVGRTKLDPTPCGITIAYGSLWITTASALLDRVDPRTGRIVAAIQVTSGEYPAIAASGAIWVSDPNDNVVIRIDPNTNKVADAISTPGIEPAGLVYADGALWVGDETDSGRQVLRIDLHTGAMKRFPGGQGPAHLATAAGAVFASDGGGTVTKLDARTGRVVAVITAGSGPADATVRSGAKPETWVTDASAGDVFRIDARTNAVIESIDTPGEGPGALTTVDGDVWVAMFSAGEVWRIHPTTR